MHLCTRVTRSTLVGLACKPKSENRVYLCIRVRKSTAPSWGDTLRNPPSVSNIPQHSQGAEQGAIATLAAPHRGSGKVSHETAQRWQQPEMRNVANITTLHYCAAKIWQTANSVRLPTNTPPCDRKKCRNTNVVLEFGSPLLATV